MEFDDDLWSDARSPQRRREVERERLLAWRASVGRAVEETRRAFASLAAPAALFFDEDPS